MKKILIMTILFALNSNAQQITWQKYLTTSPNYVNCFNIIQTKDSGFILLGYNPMLLNPTSIIKTDKFGDTLWTKTPEIVANSLVQNSNGELLLSGRDLNSSIGKILKLDMNGDTILSCYYPQYQSLSATASHDSGYILRSNTTFFKTDSLGAILWTEYTGGHLFNLLECKNGDILAMGFTGVCPGNYGLKLVDAAGNFKWSKTYGNVPQSFCQGYYYGVEDAVELPDNNFMVICDASHYPAFSSNVWGYDLMKINRQTGDTIKTIIYDSLGITRDFADIVYAKDSNLLLSFDGHIFKTDQNGLKFWENSTGVEVNDMISCSDGGFAISGVYYNGFWPNQTYSSVYAKYDSLGNCYNFQVIPYITPQLLSFYPNPAISQLTISSGQLANGKGVTVTIYDVLGKILLQQKTTTNTIDISTLAPGIYMLHAQQGDKIFNGRFVKE